MADTIDFLNRLVPHVFCKGLCQDSCGPIMMSRAEEDRLMQRHGFIPGLAILKKIKEIHESGQDVPGDLDVTCDALDTVTGKCSVYEDRPLICRLWGAVRAMKCPHGCRPGTWLTDIKAKKLQARMERVQGEGPLG